MVPRTCSKCGQTKDEDDFFFKSKLNGVRHSWCKSCHRAYERENYKKNPRRHRRKEMQFMRRLAEERDRLKSVPCADCGETYPPYVMDFDHRDKETKKGNPASLFGAGQSKQWRAEVAKCDVVCANCHRERTHRRKHKPA